jgi:hypothetical protein
MALSVGDAGATSGMTKAIYDQVNATLSPDVPGPALPDAQAAWKKLSFALATSIIEFLRRHAAEAEYAEVTSSASDDQTYWNWLAGFVKVFTDWNPAAADSVALKSGLTTFVNGKPVPTQLKGSLQ